jgi:exopolysaccharide biosynthesis polyprenyl glycosylphosphotransferase
MTMNPMYSSLSYPVLVGQWLNSQRLKWLLFVGDTLGLLGCFGLALKLRLGQSMGANDGVLLGFVGLMLIGLYFADAYRCDIPPHQLQLPAKIGLRIGLKISLSALIVAIISAAIVNFTGLWDQDLRRGCGILLPSLGWGTIWSLALRWLAIDWVRTQASQTRWLLLGTDASTRQFSQDFHQHLTGKLLALSDQCEIPTAAVSDRDTNDRELHCVGCLDDLSTWGNQPWSGVVMGTQVQFSDQQWQFLMKLRLQGIPIYHLANFYETFWQKLPSATLGDAWFALNQGFELRLEQFSWRLKRLIDITGSLILLILIAPVMLFTALAIRWDSPGPIVYSQIRTGWNGQPFRVYKFRSMYQDAESQGAQWAQERDPRITAVGYWLRIMRIDELPQIWNVLCGEMSLIGPRPERPEFDTQLAAVIPYYEMRYLVKPGITGWAQVMYPYGASIADAKEKLAYDLYYIKNYSLWLDGVIALKTVRVVLLGKGR